MPEESIENLKKQVSVLEQKLGKYEKHGGVRIYYSLNRKQNEIANALNSVDIEDLLDGDGKDKKFERIQTLLANAEKIITATQSIATMLNLTNQEERDMAKKIPFIETLAETRP